jgi:hypothetical protein
LDETGECNDFLLFIASGASTTSASDDCVSRIERLSEHREEWSSVRHSVVVVTVVVGTPPPRNIAIPFTIIRGFRL